jgi:hypothetical protein
LPNVFQNDFSSVRKATPPKEPEPKPFLEELKPYQTGANSFQESMRQVPKNVKNMNALNLSLNMFR